MTRSRLLPFLAVAFLLLLGAGAGGWWYLFGPNAVDSAELVPAGTIAFASIPNAATLVEGYQTSDLKKLIDSPNARPMQEAITNAIGKKNLDLINAFLPNLSGQSFIAVTHFDADHPEQIGLIAAMKPKAGLGDFNAFLEKLEITWPDVIKQGKTGTATVAGVNYEWIQGPGAPDKICVAQIHGWVVTTWGEAALQDWIERYQKQSSTPSLAEDADYKTSLTRVGKDPMTLAYVNYHTLLGLFQKQMAKTNPAAGDYLAKKLAALGGAAVGTRFENGEVVDRFSFLFPKSAQVDSGMGADPCPFETLKFTGPDTRLYWASSIDWKQYYKNLQEQFGSSAAVNPIANGSLNLLQSWTQGAGIDVQHVIDALGSEISVQAEWSQDSTWPEAGLFVKLDKPDDFKPAITAIIESVRKAYATSAVVKEINSNGQNFATLKFVPSGIFSPTITEDGPYLGVFLSENQAVRSFQRDPSIALTHNDSFNQLVGDKRNGASQVFFLETPYLLDRSYKTAMPYLSLAGMFNKDLAAMLQGKNLPDDLTWLAPIGSWAFVVTPDDAGIEGYSISGVGNQGIFLSGALCGAAFSLESMGLLPKPNLPGAAPVPPAIAPPPATSPAIPPPNPPADNTTNGMNLTNAPAPPAGPSDSATNTAPTNSIPDATPPPTNSAQPH